MRWMALTLCACGGSAGTQLVDAPPPAQPDIAGFDIVVSSAGVVAWVTLTGEHAQENGTFAAPGTCGGATDAFTSWSNCFSGVSIEGIQLMDGGGGPAPENPYTWRNPVTGPLTFHALDCGIAIDVSIHAGPFPMATTAKATQSETGVTVSWTTDAPYALASVGTGLFTQDCNYPTTTEHLFGWATANGQYTAAVQPLSAPEVTQTLLGEVRVWYGERTEIPVTTP